MTLLRVGTDCSGIEAPIQALKQLKIPFVHVFSSEIDPYCIQSIKANYNPRIIFGDKDGPYPIGDITKRNIKDVPDIDLYVCGFPCQTFSQAGKRAGFNDKRGIVFWSCLDVIKKKKPKYFILENVKGLINHDKGHTWKTIWDEITKLKKLGYSTHWKVLNTRDYGIPQNRERVFIIGTKSHFDFVWPSKSKMKNIKNYIDKSDTTYYNTKVKLNKYPKNSVFINMQFYKEKFVNSDRYAPCLMANSTLWNVLLHRYATMKEYLKLQGFPTSFKKVVSNSQLRKQIGNSISVNVLKVLFKNLL
jgi:DNA (cytosine-5)-methyltransferase 1